MGCELGIESFPKESQQQKRTSHPSPPGSDTEIFLPSPDKDLNMDFLLKAMANF